ncbi:tRNA 2-thiouridine(34) synthase MnmA [Papillibacter cinnamivorans]|uniref:tRNA-specific 2-thiouridylase MnmA n=1 Tax=Papillibacter cinnamivorans DSM 12816 TaxID=1122930 RepID=A0A1W2ASN0_9FIRM|nr:tRNA 2-thiouridine(34) synthase MnmA [Papillibacter cinnamivorans]SMC63749.1 tRNA-specific 2-thiouridylase [Papillibacter cinnamivorans DSM 12816]
MNRKVLIAMSGGVDSSVAAYLMTEQGYDCIGATMHLFDNKDAGIPGEKSCCSLDDVEDARSVACRLGIPYYVFNFTDDFQTQVIDRFISAYEAGATPNPCIDCNHYMKFDKLFRRASLLGCGWIATGHYARIETESGRRLLKKAADDTKDQSYVLYFMSQEQLSHTQFPLGNLRKAEIRDIAREKDFVNADKRESQDICFAPGGDYAAVIESRTGRSWHPGSFLDSSGNVLGEHRGIIRYTVGQRKGLGLSLKEPMYVREKRAEDNTVILGRNGELFSRELDAVDFNWIAFDSPPGTLRVKAKVRYRQPEQRATVSPTGETKVHLVFDEPQRAVAGGQAVVLYDGDVVMGGGTIR